MTSEFNDGLVREYLLFRGFTQSLKAFDNELKIDRDKAFRPDKITEQLFSYISSHDIQGLRDYWGYLDSKLFARLENCFSSCIRKLESGLLKLYLVHAHQNGRHEKVVDFFEKLSSELQKIHEWREWFAFPFIKNPEENPSFSMYFSKTWQDTFNASLHNFISVVIRFMPTPRLMECEIDLAKLKSVLHENERLKKQLHGNGLVSSSSGCDVGEDACAEFSVLGRDMTGTVDLMDDFAVISQEQTNQPVDLADSNSGSSQSKTIKSFIRTITLPSSPNPSSKRNPTTSTSKSEEKSRKVSSPAGPAKANLAKPRSSSNPSNTVVTRQVRSSGGVNQAPNTLPVEASVESEETTPTMPTLCLPTESETEPKSVSPLPSPPFLLLSQEDYKEHPSSIAHVRFSPTGSHVASVDVDGVVKVWSSRQAVTHATIMSKAVMTCVDWVPTGDRLLLHGNRAAAVRLFDLKENKTVSETATDTSFPRVNCVACDPKASVFMVASTSRGRVPSSSAVGTTSGLDASVRSGILQLFDLRSFKKVADFPIQPGPAHINCMKWNTNGSLCLTGASDGMIRLYDVQKRDCVAQWIAHHGDVHTIEFSKDERCCYTMGVGTGGSSAGSSIFQWSLSGEQEVELNLHGGAGGPFVLSGFGGLKQIHTPKGKLFSFDSEKRFCLTCKLNGALLYKVTSVSSATSVQPQMAIGGHKSPVVTVDWATVGDCSMCATASMDGNIKISTLLSQST